MADHSKIEWTDATFNPWIGCTKVSLACDHCYAEAWDRRFAVSGHAMHWGPGKARRRTSAANWKLPLRWEREHAAFFAQHGRRRRVFCASLADVFDNEVPGSWRADLFDLIRSTPNLDWLVLTKRIGNAMAMLDEAGGWAGIDTHGARNPLSNLKLGATAANQPEADRDIAKLLAVPAAGHFVSIEPMLGPIDLEHLGRYSAYRWINALTGWVTEGHLARSSEECSSNVACYQATRLDWVIVGGESGPGARPMHPDWARSLRDQCASAGVPFFFKQWGEWAPYDRSHTPGYALHTPNSLDEPMQMFGKRLSGRLLDGVEHNAFPEQRA
jgi:protein gp37